MRENMWQRFDVLQEDAFRKCAGGMSPLKRDKQQIIAEERKKNCGKS